MNTNKLLPECRQQFVRVRRQCLEDSFEKNKYKFCRKRTPCWPNKSHKIRTPCFNDLFVYGLI